MFDAIKKLRKSMNLKNVKKSDLPEDTNGLANPPMENDESKIDIGALASEAIVLFESGELDPELTAVSDWAKSKGMRDEDLEEFSSAVIDGYFDDDGVDPDDGIVKPIDDDEPSTNAPAPPEPQASDEIQKSILAMKRDQNLIATGLNQVLENQNKLFKIAKEFEVMKSTISKLQASPGSVRSPILEKNVQKSNQTSVSVLPGNSKEVELLILKGIQAGDLALEEMTFFEHTGKLSENAKLFVDTKMREGK